MLSLGNSLDRIARIYVFEPVLFCVQLKAFVKILIYLFSTTWHSSVFWDLYCASPERRESFDHSSEAKAFHDYVSIVLKTNVKR